MSTLPIDAIDVTERYRADYGDIDALAASMEDVGLLQPIAVTPEHKLIAGERRLRAAQQLGWAEIPVTVIDGLDDAQEYFSAQRDENTCRKDFTPSEAVELGKKLEALEKPKAEERQRELGKTHGTPSGNLPQGGAGKTRDRVGEALGMSGRTYEKARDVVDAADKEPDEYGDLVEKMDNTSVHAADKERRERKKQCEEEARAAAIPDDTPRYTLHCAGIRDLTDHIAPDSIDVVITDPPYAQEYLWVYEHLGEVAEYALCPGGSLIVMVGQSYLPAVIASLNKMLNYHWTAAYLTPGGQAAQLWQRKVNTFWKPLLWFVKGDYEGDWIGDVAQSDVNANEKEDHKWGQSVSGMTDIVERFTAPGDTILDPFLGGGTTGVVAMMEDRQFIGSDIDNTAIDTAKVRISEVC